MYISEQISVMGNFRRELYTCLISQYDEVVTIKILRCCIAYNTTRITEVPTLESEIYEERGNIFASANEFF